MKNPKITVLMSVYNGDKYLNQAIDSILNQTFKDFEFLIVNDGSTDKTSEILQSYKDSRIEIINNKKNIGLTKSLNKGLKLAKGECIARMDADDISMPERFEKEMEFLDNHLDYAVVGSFAKIINEKTEVQYLLERPTENFRIKKWLEKDNCIVHGSSMIRKSCLLNIGFYDELMTKSQDYDLWLRLSKMYCLANIPEYLYMWRRHDENIKTKYVNEQKVLVVLAIIKNNILNVDQASRDFIDKIVQKNIVPKIKLLTIFFIMVNLLTLNRIGIYTLYKIYYRIKLMKKVKITLNNYKTKKISFDIAKTEIINIINMKQRNYDKKTKIY